MKGSIKDWNVQDRSLADKHAVKTLGHNPHLHLHRWHRKSFKQELNLVSSKAPDQDKELAAFKEPLTCQKTPFYEGNLILPKNWH